MKLSGKILSVLIATLMLVTLALPAFAASESPEAVLADILKAHREFANDEQEAVLAEIEGKYDAVKALGADEAPWSDIATALLTDGIKANTDFKNTIVLEELMDKELAAEGVSGGIKNEIDAFSAALNVIYETYSFDDSTVSEAASKIDEFTGDMSELYGRLSTILTNVADANSVLKADGEDYVALTDDEIYDIMAEKIVGVIKSVNAVVFSTKETYEAAFDGLFSDVNIKTLGIIFGKDLADILKEESAADAISEYLGGEKLLSALINNTTELLDGTKEEAVTAFYGMVSEVVNDILALDTLDGAKEAIEAAGWTVSGFVDACKAAADAADDEYLSRIININMFFGRYLTVMSDDEIQEAPITIHSKVPDADAYDVSLIKGKVNASILNLINPVVYTRSDVVSEDVTAIGNRGILTFEVVSDTTGRFNLKFFRSGGTDDVYGYLGEIEARIDDKIPVTSVTIRGSKSVTMEVGGTKTLDIQILPVKAYNQNVTWESEDTKIATVSDSGKITAKAKGTTTITVTTDDGGYTASVELTVNRKSTSTSSTGSTSSGTQTSSVSTSTSDNSNSTSQPEMTVKAFNDMAGHWAEDDINKLYNDGVVTGYSDGSGNFYPNLDITRAEFAVIISRMMNLAPITDGTVYTDTADHWSRGYVATATKYGLMIGFDDGSFGPDLPITREQAVSVIIRAKYFGGNVVNNGDEVISGDAVIEKIQNDYGVEISDAGIADIETASAWARPYINLATQNGWLKGYEGNVVLPLNNATRAEASVMAIRVLY